MRAFFGLSGGSSRLAGSTPINDPVKPLSRVPHVLLDASTIRCSEAVKGAFLVLFSHVLYDTFLVPVRFPQVSLEAESIGETGGIVDIG
jgi:hypothetical protein